MINTIANFLYNILDAVGNILPRDPFVQFFTVPDAVIYKYLGWINWLIPVQFMVSTFEAFLIAYGSYLLISAILRWIAYNYMIMRLFQVAIFVCISVM